MCVYFIFFLHHFKVKTWFQNRRMKLKRHQKENGWVNERYANNGYPGVAPTPLPQVMQKLNLIFFFSPPSVCAACLAPGRRGKHAGEMKCVHNRRHFHSHGICLKGRTLHTNIV